MTPPAEESPHLGLLLGYRLKAWEPPPPMIGGDYQGTGWLGRAGREGMDSVCEEKDLGRFRKVFDLFRRERV